MAVKNSTSSGGGGGTGSTSSSNPHHYHQSSSSSTTTTTTTGGGSGGHGRRNLLQQLHPTNATEALLQQAVVRPLQRTVTLRQPQHAAKHEGDDVNDDPIGNQMTRLLNSHPDFHYATSSSSAAAAAGLLRKQQQEEEASIPEEDEQEDEGFTLFPLFCRRNWLVLKRLLVSIRQEVHPLSLLLSVIGFCYEKAATHDRQKILDLIDRTSLLFVAIGAIGICFVTITSHYAIQFASHAGWLLLLQISFLLLDWKDIQQNLLPSQLHWFYNNVLVTIVDWFDQYLFLRKRYTGREWNTQEFVMDNHKIHYKGGQSRHETLWELPPPCLNTKTLKDRQSRDLCLDPRYMMSRQEEWSYETTQHVVAINFCYLMMREDHLRKQARQQYKDQKNNKKKRSSHKKRNQQQSTIHEKYSEDEDYDNAFDEDDDVLEQAPSSSADDNYDDNDDMHRHQVMSLTTRTGRHTREQVRGLASNSPSGGIELVRDSLRNIDTFTSQQDLMEQHQQQQRRRDSNSISTPFQIMSSSGGHHHDASHNDSHNNNSLLESPTHNSIGGGGGGRFLDDNSNSDDDDDESTSSSVESCSSAVAADMHWFDISARIGMRVLNSAHLQRVVASEEAAERLKNITDQFVTASSPSGAAIITQQENNNNNYPDNASSSTTTTTALATTTTKNTNAITNSNNNSNNNNNNETTSSSTALAIPYEVQSLTDLALGTLQKAALQNSTIPHPTTINNTSLIKTPCRPVHSMWTSASAAAFALNDLSEEEEEEDEEEEGEEEGEGSTIASLDLGGWGKESKSGELVDDYYHHHHRHNLGGPAAPPTIIRTRHFPTTTTTGGYTTAEQSSSFSFSQQNRSFSSTTTEISPIREIKVVEILQSSTTPNTGGGGGATTMTYHRQESSFLEEESLEVFVDTDSMHHIHNKDHNDSLHNNRTRARTYSQSTSHHQRVYNERPPLAPGVKVAVPFCPMQPGVKRGKVRGHSNYQMATVVSSKRIYVDNTTTTTNTSMITSPTRAAAMAIGCHFTNCLSVTCKVDKSFLRNGEFTEITFRVMDEWGSRYMPKHSKVPIGACVATTFGIGIVVGWRVEDDCHVIRSLWQRRGAGSAHAYLNRDAIHGVLEAAVGFEVLTKCGSGKVMGYVDAGRTWQNGRYVVTLQDEGVYKNCVVTLHRKDIHACHGAQFIPVIEHIKEACDYQIMLDTYRALVRQQKFNDENNESADDYLWKFWTENLDILWKSFLKAVEEDSEFDEGVDNLLGSVIEFLQRLDHAPASKQNSSSTTTTSKKTEDKAAAVGGGGDDASASASCDSRPSSNINQSLTDGTDHENDQDAGFWILNDMLGGIFPPRTKKDKTDADTVSTDANTQMDEEQSVALDTTAANQRDRSAISYKRAFAVIRTLMRTVSLAGAASAKKPQFRLAMTICREFLMFVRTLIKVQQKNVSPQSLEVWRAALQEIVSTFGPLQERLEKIGRGVAQRMEQQGRRAKIRVLRFADSILLDEIFLNALCQGEWKQCLVRIEMALVKAKIIDEASCGHYRKTARFIYDHLLILSAKESSATERNNEKLAKFAKLVQLIASPKRSLLKLIRNDDVLEILERILVRVFCREEVASRMLTIHACNFKSLRHLRILKDLSVSGRMWIPLLDAADAEFSYVVSGMPEHAKEVMCPLSSIFSLLVAQFHKISAGHSTKDWLDFLMEEDGVRIIHDLDMKLILALSSFSRDVKDMMLVIPYYPSIDDDILNFMDEVELDKLLKEASDAIDDADKLAAFIREKAATAIERFLAYLPKLSIPVERRDLGEGWVLTVGQDGGGDLTLSDVKVKRENLVCEVMGGDALFLPIFGEDDLDKSLTSSAPGSRAGGGERSGPPDRIEESILDHIRDMISQAQRHGNWTVGVGGVGRPSSDPYVASVLQNLPLSSVLSCGIDLWRNLEIDDDELLEIAIRDVSYQIQLHKEMEERAAEQEEDAQSLSKSYPSGLQSSLSGSVSFEEAARRFNPRVDPTVLLLEMKNMTLHLERFRFRIEKGEKRTIFDPVFEGCGTVSIQNLNILLRVECARERIGKVGSTSVAPVLILRELEVEIEHVRLKVEDTGADWLLNKAVKGFSENITDVVESNLKEQIQEQTKQTLEQLNSYFSVNQDILLNLLGISLEDLEEHIVWV